MSMKKAFGLYLLFISFVIAACTASSQKMRKANLLQALSRPVETWSIEECEAIINRYSVANLKWNSGYPSGYGLSGKNIFILATPFTRDVIQAIDRKEAIQRRFSIQKFRKRLKEDLESFTNYSLDEQTGKILEKSPNAENYLNEYTFKIYFVNISDPYRTIRVFRAEEGFFLQREDGKFTRAIEMSGTESDAFFTLYNDLYTMVTFSAFTDDGERIEFNDRNMHQFKLVFTSLQKKPIELKWEKF